MESSYDSETSKEGDERRDCVPSDEGAEMEVLLNERCKEGVVIDQKGWWCSDEEDGPALWSGKVGDDLEARFEKI